MPLLRIVLVPLILIMIVVAYAAIRRRHRCAHKDPVCRRDRPCIACYRELYCNVDVNRSS
jgi:hypothetical protein